MVKGSGSTSWTLGRVLGDDTDPRRFWRDHGHHAALFRSDPERFAELTSLGRALELVAAAPPDHRESLRGVSQPFDPAAGSFRLLRAQALDDTLRAFALDLLAELGEEINVNLYFSPPGAEGLGRHADLYDVIVVQIAGRKRWELSGFERGIDEPFGPVGGGVVAGTTGRLTLEPGDVLFLPTGLHHRAENPGPETSFHLTVGIFTKSDRSVAEWLAHTLAGAPRARWAPAAARDGDYDASIDRAGAEATALLTAPDRVERFLAHRQRVEYERTIADVAEHRRLDARGYR